MKRALLLAAHSVLPSWAGPEHPDRRQGKKRSPDWPAFRKQWLLGHPRCAVCGATKNVVPHHLEPFSLFPQRELDKLNVVTLCEGPGVNCHLLFGHLNNFASYNPTCLEDAEEWKEKIERRPK